MDDAFHTIIHFVFNTDWWAFIKHYALLWAVVLLIAAPVRFFGWLFSPTKPKDK